MVSIGKIVSGCLLAGVAVLAGGCRSTPEYVRIATPLPPPFLIGPAAVFLTNTTGFSAQVESKSTLPASDEIPTTGQLIGAGAKLLFAPVRNKEEKRSHPGNFLFIWDVAEGRGIVISEALQGYAPISSDVRVTNVFASPDQTVVNLQMNNGTASAFQVVRSAQWKGFPARITSVKDPVPFAVTFSKMRFEPVTGGIFDPPDGFAKYESPEAMVDELAARQRNFRRKGGDIEQYQDLLRQQQSH